MKHCLRIQLLLIGSIVLCLSQAFCEADEFAQDSELWGIHYRIENNKSIITSYTGNDQVLFIPKQLNGYEVVKIDSFAFANNELIWMIILPNSIIEICDYAFHMSSLRSIVLNDSIQYIGVGAFSGSHLTSLYLPPSVMDIGDHICRNCASLRSVRIDANIQTIPKSAFFECINLYDIQLPECLETIETEAFYNCKELEFIVIPKNTSYIDGTAFYDCWNLKDNPVMEDYIICGEECNE